MSESIKASLRLFLQDSDSPVLLIDSVDLHEELTERHLELPVKTVAKQREYVFEFLVKNFEGKGIDFPVYDSGGYACYKVKRQELLRQMDLIS